MLTSVSTGLEGAQFRRFEGNHRDENVDFGHTNAPMGPTVEALSYSRPGKSRPNINASNYLPAHPTGKAMLKHGVRSGYRGSIPWPGRGRSQRTRDPIGR